jgi:hypothetical protein
MRLPERLKNVPGRKPSMLPQPKLKPEWNEDYILTQLVRMEFLKGKSDWDAGRRALAEAAMHYNDQLHVLYARFPNSVQSAVHPGESVFDKVGALERLVWDWNEFEKLSGAMIGETSRHMMREAIQEPSTSNHAREGEGAISILPTYDADKVRVIRERRSGEDKTQSWSAKATDRVGYIADGTFLLYQALVRGVNVKIDPGKAIKPEAEAWDYARKLSSEIDIRNFGGPPSGRLTGISFVLGQLDGDYAKKPRSQATDAVLNDLAKKDLAN